MKKSVTKRVVSLVLALAVVIGGVFVNVAPAKADTTALATTDYTYVTAGQEFKFTFSLDQPSDVEVDIFVTNPSTTQISVYNSAGNLMDWQDNPFSIDSSYYIELGSDQLGTLYGYPDALTGLSAGSYTYGVTFASDTYVALGAYLATPTAKISEEKVTITKGFTKTLSVSNGTVKKWSSSKTSVATVNSKGKVTAKKGGSTTITATLTDGTKLTCKVTVKANKYSDSKITTSDVYYGECAMSAYSVSYDSKGNLVIKVTFVNNTSYKVTKLKNIKIVVKDKNGKTIGTYKKSSQSVTVPAGSTKNLTYTIKKSSLKKKNADLRLISDISYDGEYISTYY